MTRKNIPTISLVAAGVILVMVVAVLWRYWDYVVNPWTRNGQIMAQVIQITPRVVDQHVDAGEALQQFPGGSANIVKPGEIGKHYIDRRLTHGL